ncbi:hypothetical protein QO058_20845 [Bosea vestrisii]|uniref:hypothetical protein n=1 Tax=Bosea vestrisii TaxID=151416 RepID=UPI0024DFFE5F|nr:hypothetical protein [Bosea vestrisii]WID95221.1 hypothetical protein QO058_20845 [Bosea vestrisii]
MIEVLSTGLLNSVQDQGRMGYLDIGVSTCGPIDRLAYELANALLDNPSNAAAIEVALFPFRIKFHGDANFAVTGAVCDTKLDGMRLPPCWMRSARAGQTLTIGAPRRGARAFLAVGGGFDVPEVLGSRATDQKKRVRRPGRPGPEAR